MQKMAPSPVKAKLSTSRAELLARLQALGSVEEVSKAIGTVHTPEPHSRQLRLTLDSWCMAMACPLRCSLYR